MGLGRAPGPPRPENGMISIGIVMIKTTLVLLSLAPIALAQSLSGLWDATVNVNGVDIPFRIEFSGSGANVKGTFFNGDDKFTSTGGRFENGALVLNWDYYASKLEATLKDSVLEGRYSRGANGYPFT